MLQGEKNDGVVKYARMIESSLGYDAYALADGGGKARALKDSDFTCPHELNIIV